MIRNLAGQTVGAQMIVRVKARAIFPNCPRYIPKMQLAEPSVYVPQPGCDPVEPVAGDRKLRHRPRYSPATAALQYIIDTGDPVRLLAPRRRRDPAIESGRDE